MSIPTACAVNSQPRPTALCMLGHRVCVSHIARTRYARCPQACGRVMACFRALWHAGPLLCAVWFARSAAGTKPAHGKRASPQAQASRCARTLAAGGSALRLPRPRWNCIRRAAPATCESHPSHGCETAARRRWRLRLPVHKGEQQLLQIRSRRGGTGAGDDGCAR